MLLGLNLKNFTIIDEISVSFTPGLNIITGETGAGKSVIVDAVNIILGEKATPDHIKTGQDESRLQALFDISGYPRIKERLLSSGFDAPGEELLIKRVLYRKGRSRVYINGETATLPILEHVTKGLIEVFSQHEHQSLLKRENHLRVLDELGNYGEELLKLGELYNKHREVKNELREMTENIRSRTEKEDFLKFQLDEIKTSELKPGEDAELESEKLKLVNSEKLLSATQSAYEAIYEKEPSLAGTLKNLSVDIAEAAKIDATLSEIAKSLQSSTLQIEEAAFTLRDYASQLSSDTGRLDEIEEKLRDIGALKRKYGDSIAQILEKRDDIQKELGEIVNHDALTEALKEELLRVEKVYYRKAEKISKMRRATAVPLSKRLEGELRHVGIKGAQFSVEFGKRDMSSLGIDDVSFLFSANPDEVPKPLNKVASGGELSRIMLVIKEAIARTDGGSVIIFDEADSGIGGAVAETVGEKIKKLSATYQVICITHLPQVAKFGDSHLTVSKTIEGGKTTVHIKNLKYEERAQELARMIGGLKITRKTLDAAHEMLDL